jgi:hypothetical protein
VIDRRTASVLGLTAALSTIPVWADLLFSWRHAVFRYFASDAYYYLTIARNMARTGVPSFDGEYPTNGFHPLWQLLLALLYKTCRSLGADELTFCYLVVILGNLLVTLALVLLGITFARSRGSLPATFPLLPVGLYAFLVCPAWIWIQAVLRNESPTEGPLPLHGTAWSYANGMESGLALFSWALFALLATARSSPNARFAWLLGLAAAFVVLARLDQVFLAGAALAFASLRRLAEEGRKALGPLLRTAIAFGGPIALYLLVNVLYSGLAFPVSGTSKLSFAAAGRSHMESLTTLATMGTGTPFWLDRLFRLTQTLVPAAVAAAFLATSLRVVRTPRGPRLRLRGEDELSRFLAATAVGVLILCGAVFLFTDARSYGSWSLPVPVLFVSLVGLHLLAGRAPCRGARLALAISTAAVLAVFLTLHRQPEHHERYRRMYFSRDAIVAALGARHPRLVEVDDGIVGFTTRFPTLSGLGFAADKELRLAIREGRVLQLARARGYDRLASVIYLPLSPGPESSLRSLASAYRDGRPASWTLEYWDPNVPFALVKFTEDAP